MKYKEDLIEKFKKSKPELAVIIGPVLEDIINSTFPEFDGVRLTCGGLMLENNKGKSYRIIVENIENQNTTGTYKISIASLFKEIFNISYEINLTTNVPTLKITDLIYMYDDDIITYKASDNELDKINIYTNSGCIIGYGNGITCSEITLNNGLSNILTPDYSKEVKIIDSTIVICDENMESEGANATSYITYQDSNLRSKAKQLRSACNEIHREIIASDMPHNKDIRRYVKKK